MKRFTRTGDSSWQVGEVEQERSTLSWLPGAILAGVGVVCVVAIGLGLLEAFLTVSGGRLSCTLR